MSETKTKLLCVQRQLTLTQVTSHEAIYPDFRQMFLHVV